MQLDPIKITLKPPGTKRLKLKYVKVLQFCFNFAFKFNLRRYFLAMREAAERCDLRNQLQEAAWAADNFCEVGPHRLCVLRRHIIHHVLYRCSPRRPLHGIPVLPALFSLL